jgi:hypothetical protein
MFSGSLNLLLTYSPEDFRLVMNTNTKGYNAINAKTTKMEYMIALTDFL